jgi:hypothetical protein
VSAEETITLIGRTYGEVTIKVSRDEYEQAKADDKVDHLLDTWLSDMDETTTVTEPDGTTYDPYGDITDTWVEVDDKDENGGAA